MRWLQNCLPEGVLPGESSAGVRREAGKSRGSRGGFQVSSSLSVTPGVPGVSDTTEVVPPGGTGSIGQSPAKDL